MSKKMNENNIEIAELLMGAEGHICRHYGWDSGDDIRENWKKYVEEVEVIVSPYLCENKINFIVLNELTANNWHNLRDAIEEIQNKY